MSLPQTLSWDIFCTVIDNFGDIGVTWRLARQLAREHRQLVRLWVDDLHAFQRIQPRLQVELETQNLDGVEIHHWGQTLPALAPGQVVVEALACNLPDEFIARMVQTQVKPIWINLEYLSAEHWVEGVHGLPSPHPPLEKYFFMPGFNVRTGGLSRENELIAQRQHFQGDPDMQARFLAGLDLPPMASATQRISLFSYENKALPSLLQSCADSAQQTLLLVPEGKALADIAHWLGRPTMHLGERIEAGQLTVKVLPMLDQDQYDRLLWACDWNFVRGEDSFVRAQFAARPMVWQAYPQEDEAHLDKLNAFLAIYCSSMTSSQAEITRDFYQAWNRQESVQGLWPCLSADDPTLLGHARNWSAELASQPDLASNLLIFCKKKLESRA